MIRGKSIDPAMMLTQYEYIIVCIHGGDVAYDRAVAQLSTCTGNVFFLYNVSDSLFHHAERLHTLIQHNLVRGSVKFPHQKHVHMKAYNDAVTSAEDIARAHVRELFLPIQIVDTHHRRQVPMIHNARLAYTPNEFVALIHQHRHDSDSLTLREHISGSTVFVATIPGFRGQNMYTTIPLIYKVVNGVGYWDTVKLSHDERSSLHQTVTDVSSLVFTKQVVVYALSIHPRRGVFIQSTAPMFDYMIHHPDFFFAVASESAIAPVELFVLLRDRP